MFETLSDQMKHDAQAEGTRAQRLVPWVVGILATAVVLGGMYFAFQLMGR